MGWRKKGGCVCATNQRRVNIFFVGEAGPLALAPGPGPGPPVNATETRNWPTPSRKGASKPDRTVAYTSQDSTVVRSRLYRDRHRDRAEDGR
jgi:hypothetical protein